jgi:starvation-inducible DNA-binding protein
MYDTKNDIGKSLRVKLNALLNQRLADVIDLQIQLKQAHWNVKGPNFISLHELFDKVSTGIEAYSDTIAERIVQLGGIAEGTIRVASARSKLDEYPLSIGDGTDHVKATVAAIAKFGTMVRHSITEATKLNDDDTADIFTEVSRGVDKWLWFVEAHRQADR